MSTVLVTGGSGFVGSHTILQLLAAGHRVRTTVRNLSREADVRAMLKTGGATNLESLSFYAADLERDAGWKEATEGCEFVLHVASPFPASNPKNEDELIIPAREGSLRVLQAARAAGVARVVLTSSFAAIGYGHADTTKPFDETFWTDPTRPGIQAYVKSKVLAERAAWDFISGDGKGMELSAVNPVGIFGPLLGADYASSIALLRSMLEGKVPAVPRLFFGVTDVRDVADLHLRAMTNPAAAGERFLCCGDRFLSLIEIAKILRSNLGEDAKRVPTREIPDWVVKIAALFVPLMKQAAPEVGRTKQGSNEKAKRLLQWSPRSNEEALLASARGLIRLGLLNKK